MSESNCSIHDRCIWELALEGAKSNSDTAIRRMEKAQLELTKIQKRVEVLESAMKLVKESLEECDFSCDRCGLDPKATEFDIYIDVTRALKDSSDIAWSNGN